MLRTISYKFSPDYFPILNNQQNVKFLNTYLFIAYEYYINLEQIEKKWTSSNVQLPSPFLFTPVNPNYIIISSIGIGVHVISIITAGLFDPLPELYCLVIRVVGDVVAVRLGCPRTATDSSTNTTVRSAHHFGGRPKTAFSAATTLKLAFIGLVHKASHCSIVADFRRQSFRYRCRRALSRFLRWRRLARIRAV